MLATLLCLFLLVPQTDLQIAIQLRNDYEKATQDYIASLEKLLRSYEEDVRRSEERGNSKAVTAAQKRIDEVRLQIAHEQKRLAEMPSVEQVEEDYKRALRKRKQARKPTCKDWALTVFRRQRGRTITFGYNVVCSY